MIFTAQTQRAIRNKGMAAVYGLAAEFDCEPGDVLDLLVTGPLTETSIPVSAPSQPASSHAPAVTAPAAAPADATTDGGAVAHPSATPSVDQFQPWSVEPGSVISAPFVVTGDLNATPSPLPGDPADGADIPPNRVSAPSAAFSPAKKRTKGRGLLVEASIRGNPEWTDLQHAERLGVDPAYVRRTASRLKLTLTSRLVQRKAQQDATTEALKAAPAKPQEPVERAGPPTPRPEPKQPPAAKSVDPKRLPIKHQVANLHSMHPDWDAARIAQEIGAKLGTVETALYEARAAAGESLSEPIPPANPQKPIAPPPTGEKRTLTERVRSLHQQHPTWTATMIAHELGAKQTSVSTILGQVRGKAAPPPEQPQFTGRRQMIEHYGEIAKRLGKS